MAPDLDTTTTGIFHQENERPGILRKISQRDVLPIAAEVGKAQRFLVHFFKKSRRTTPVLNVGLPLGVRRSQVEHVQFRKEGFQFRSDRRFPTAVRFHSGIAGPGTLLCLNGFHRGREGDVAGECAHGKVSPNWQLLRSHPAVDFPAVM